MGVHNSKYSTIDVKNTTLTLQKSIDNSPLGPMKIYKTDDGKLIIKKKIVLDKVDYSKRIDLTHPNLYQTLAYNTNVLNVMGTFLEANSIYFEFGNLCCANYFEDRRVRGGSFSDFEVRQLLTDLTAVLGYLQDNKIAHGDICNDTVFYDESTRKFKVYDQEIMVGLDIAYLSAKTKKRFCWLAPETILAVTENDQSFFADQYKADAFALGLLALEMATLQPSVELYYDDFKLNLPDLDQRLNSITNKVQPHTVSVIRQLLDMDPLKRPSWKQLGEQLRVPQYQRPKPVNVESTSPKKKDERKIEEPVKADGKLLQQSPERKPKQVDQSPKKLPPPIITQTIIQPQPVIVQQPQIVSPMIQSRPPVVVQQQPQPVVTREPV